ncbi:hypothetical protein M8J75_012831 [Diaphorina citri]|nr:hypothetical protein M8J75_012831 [Diaphorina citri]
MTTSVSRIPQLYVNNRKASSHRRRSASCVTHRYTSEIISLDAIDSVDIEQLSRKKRHRSHSRHHDGKYERTRVSTNLNEAKNERTRVSANLDEGKYERSRVSTNLNEAKNERTRVSTNLNEEDTRRTGDSRIVSCDNGKFRVSRVDINGNSSSEENETETGGVDLRQVKHTFASLTRIVKSNQSANLATKFAVKNKSFGQPMDLSDEVLDNRCLPNSSDVKRGGNINTNALYGLRNTNDNDNSGGKRRETEGARSGTRVNTIDNEPARVRNINKVGNINMNTSAPTDSTNDLSSSNNGGSATNNSNSNLYANPTATKHEFAMWNSVGPAVNRLATSTTFKSDDGVALTSRSYSEQQLGVKVDMVYGLISMLDNHNRDEMTRTLLAMSHSPDTCGAMRQSGCISLLVQLIHCEDEDCTVEVRDRAAQALHNLIHCHQDDKVGRREVRVLRLLEKIRQYTESMSEATQHSDQEEIGQVIAALMKLSFDEDHRYAMCQLGALFTLAKLIQVDTQCHGLTNKYCIILRRYAGMTLTNLTFGHADVKSKQILREVGAVPALMKSAMEASKESTLKSILSALWNFSAHCNNNKIDICQVEGALQFLIDKMKSSTATSMTIVENAGGVMRNISSHISVKENYRAILREHQCLPLLLEQLRSPSLTVVSNACGTLWNLSARCPQDQATLCRLGAGPMLSSLIHSRHKMIAMGASAALKNLLNAKTATGAPECNLFDKDSRGMPSLLIRKRRALEKELDANLAETCDNIDNADLASPLTPQSSTPLSVFTSHHHMMTSTSNSNTSNPEDKPHDEEEPTSDVHNTSDNNNTQDHTTPLTRSPSPSPSYHNQTTTPTSSYTPRDERDGASSEPEEREREQLSFSKIEEPYYHPHLDDEDSNEPSNLDQPTNYSLRYSEKRGEPPGSSSGDSEDRPGSKIFTDEARVESKFAEDNGEDCVRTFCTEDTPYNFSNSTSLSDLRITEGDGGELSACKTPEDSKPPSGRSSPHLKPGGHTGGESHTPPLLGGPSMGCDETPLMFSRCSSLESVSSCDGGEATHPGDDRSSVAPEDRYSVVSEFSRMTSGMISPSDLPDSPIHTAPVSPSPRGPKFSFPPTERGVGGAKFYPPQGGGKGHRSVFEDTVATYKHDDDEEVKTSREGEGESHPVTSLSHPPPASLPPPPTSAKDELKCYAVEESPLNLTAWSSLSDLTINTNTSVSARHNTSSRPDNDDRHEDLFHEDGVEGGGENKEEEEEEMLNDEHILQACIKVGMESAKCLTLKKTSSESSQPSNHHLDDQTEDDDNVLAQCIQLGMTATSKPLSHPSSNPSNPSPGIKPCQPPVPKPAGLGKSSPAMKPSAPATQEGPGVQHSPGEAARLPPTVPAPIAPGAVGLKIDLSDEEILQQCILEGMSGYVHNQDSDETLLTQCIRAGMEKFKLEISKKQNSGNSSSSREQSGAGETQSTISSKLPSQQSAPHLASQSEDRTTTNPNTSHTNNSNIDFDLDQWANDVQDNDSALLLEQCIEAGIPHKSKNAHAPSVPTLPPPLTHPSTTPTPTHPSTTPTPSPMTDGGENPRVLPRDIDTWQGVETVKENGDIAKRREEIEKHNGNMVKQNGEIPREHKNEQRGTQQNGEAVRTLDKSGKESHQNTNIGITEARKTSNEPKMEMKNECNSEHNQTYGKPTLTENKPNPQQYPTRTNANGSNVNGTVSDSNNSNNSVPQRSNGSDLKQSSCSDPKQSSSSDLKQSNTLERSINGSVKHRMISSLIKSNTSTLATSMDNSWRLDGDLNDDLCEGLDTSGATLLSEDELAGIDRGIETGRIDFQTMETGRIDSQSIETAAIDRRLEIESQIESLRIHDKNSPVRKAIPADLKDSMDEMKASLTNTWSDDSSTSYPTVSLSPPSCLKPGNVFEYNKQNGEKVKEYNKQNADTVKDISTHVNGKDIPVSLGFDHAKSPDTARKPTGILSDVEPTGASTNNSPVRKTVAKVNPFPETARNLVLQSQGKEEKELIKQSGNGVDSLVLNGDQIKYSPHILELDCGKLGIISSLEFEDLNSVKPPRSMTSMHSSINLENIKPPSYFDEVSYLEDSALDASICNIDSIVSEVADNEQFDDDESTLIEDEIPLDPHQVTLEHQEAYQQSPRLKRKVTPKQKRNLSKERYNTYTIQCEESAAPTKLTPKQKRQQDRDRYATRTILDDDDTLVNHDTFVLTDDTPTLMSGNNSEIEDLEMDDEPQPKPSRTSSPSKICKLVTPKSVKIPQYKANEPKPKSCIPGPVKSIQPLQRQGTFTKDEPSTPNISSIPVLSSISCQSTPKKSPATGNTIGIKLRNNSQPNMKRNSGVRSSLSNTNLKGELATSKLNTSTPGNLNRRSYIDLSSSRGEYVKLARKSQSNSNSSLNSSGSSGVTCVKQPAAGKTPSSVKKPTPAVTSKIASLWKKVEDSKKTSGIKKDTRVWIGK